MKLFLVSAVVLQTWQTLALHVPLGWPHDGLSMSGRKILSRRAFGVLGAASTLGAIPSVKSAAYDSLPSQDADFAEMEKRRKIRADAVEKNRLAVKPYIKKIQAATDAESFSAAADSFSLWLIGEGGLPEGIDASAIRDALNEQYDTLPKKAYACEKTRTNDGICFSPGPNAENAYTSCIRE